MIAGYRWQRSRIRHWAVIVVGVEASIYELQLMVGLPMPPDRLVLPLKRDLSLYSVLSSFNIRL